MNKNIDLTKILKDCPRGYELYSPICGPVLFFNVLNDNSPYPINVKSIEGHSIDFTKEGYYYDNCEYVEVLLFPSKDQRDWSKFTAPWYKKERFNPRTLKPFNKVLARINKNGFWCCELFSFIEDNTNLIKCCGAYYQYCVPYNDDTKHLIGTTEEVPEYYRYWEK